jgi:hypothetical protein
VNRNRVLFVLMVVCLATASRPSGASTWQTKPWLDVNGKTGVALVLKQGEYVLQFNCSEGAGAYLNMVLIGRTFSNLESVDDRNAELTFEFELPEGKVTRNTVKAWYFGPDHAWTGQFPMGPDFYTSFSTAQLIYLLNPAGELILTFTTSGLKSGAEAIQSHCQRGE